MRPKRRRRGFFGCDGTVASAGVFTIIAIEQLPCQLDSHKHHPTLPHQKQGQYHTLIKYNPPAGATSRALLRPVRNPFAISSTPILPNATRIIAPTIIRTILYKKPSPEISIVTSDPRRRTLTVEIVRTVLSPVFPRFAA